MPNGYWAVIGATVLLSACTNTSNDTHPFERYTLANDMEVLIWPNSNSESNNEVDMNLVIKVGSEDERPEQAGLAHFVEHMAFEQIDASDQNPIETWLDGLSLENRSHANAYTTFDRTHYYLHFSDTSASRMQQGVDLLAHIASQTGFDKQETEQEKAIIQAEWRYRENKETARDMWTKFALEEHPWRNHLPIGNMDVVSHVTVHQLAEFYKTHYRPDNAFLVVTGDFDSSDLKQQISDTFSGWQKPDEPYLVGTSVLKIPSAKIHTLRAPDTLGSNLQLEGFSDNWSVRSEEDLYRAEMISAIFSVLQQRLTRVVNREQLNMNLHAYFGHHLSDRHLGHFVFEANGDTKDLQKATSLLSREWARMAQYGLTQDELNSWRETVLKKEKNNLDSAEHLARKSVDSLMSGELLQGQDQYYRFLEQSLPKFTPKQSQIIAEEVLTFSPRITLTQNPTETTPTNTQLQEWSRWPSQVAAPLGGQKLHEAWAVIKQPGAISAHEILPNDIEIFTLSNGIKVYYSRLKNNSDRIDIQFVGQGGLNVLSDEAALQARLALGVMAASGLRSFDGPALNRWINERDIVLTPYFTYYTRELQLEGATTDAETLFRLAHITLTEAKVDEQVLNHQKQSLVSLIRKQASGNRDEFDHLIEKVLYQSDTRQRRMTEQEVIDISKSDIEKIYGRYYSGSQTYQVFITGDIEPSELRDHLTHYVANIPVNNPSHEILKYFPKLQKSERVTGQGIGGEASFITLMYEVDKEDYRWVNNSLLQAEAIQFSEQLTSTIREELGLTYAVSASFSGGSTLNNTVRMQIDLSVAPDQVDKIIEVINQQISIRANQVIDASKIDLMQLKQRKQFNKAVNSNNRMILMATADLLDRPKATLFDANISVKHYDATQVNQLYRGLMSEQARHVEFVLNP